MQNFGAAYGRLGSFATGRVLLRSHSLDRNALEADMIRGLPARQERDEIVGAKQRSLTDLDAP